MLLARIDDWLAAIDLDPHLAAIRLVSEPVVVQKSLVGASRIFPAPRQRLKNHLVFVGSGDMPQESPFS
jgi:hypothetical protein